MTQTRKRVRRGPGRPARSENRDTRGDILTAAAKLFAVTGFDATSLRQIAGEATVDLATVKYHFPKNAALYDAAYRLGHARFIDEFSPLMVAISDADSREGLNGALRQVARACADFVQTERNFVRLTLFRMLEGVNRADPSSTTLIQSDFIELLTSGVDRAVTEKLARRFDVSALLSFAVVGLPMWVVATEVQPHQVGIRNTEAPEWNERIEQFVGDLLTSMVLHRAS